MSARFAARFVNRNPCANTLAGRARPMSKPQFDKGAPAALYKVELISSKSHQEARVVHWRDGAVVAASTREAAIASQLYSKVDTCASLNVARVLALRCLRAGIHYAVPEATMEERSRSEHLKVFYETLETEGLTLQQPKMVEHGYEVDKRMTWERYPIKHTREDKIDEL